MEKTGQAIDKSGRLPLDVQERYRRYVDENHLYGGRGYAPLEHRCRQMFSRLGGLEDKTMLEIGGGEGLLSLWALANGLKRIILLEPEVDGSTRGALDRCLAHKRALGIRNDYLRISPVTIQEYEGKDDSFDLVLSYSSINHLDESACVQLKRSEEARIKYLQIFQKVSDLLRSGGHFVISDAGRFNLWGLAGLRSPFSPTIDWKKHQEPVLWGRLLESVGFEIVGLDWHRFYPLRWVGWLAANGLVARAMTSQFVLTVRKP